MIPTAVARAPARGDAPAAAVHSGVRALVAKLYDRPNSDSSVVLVLYCVRLHETAREQDVKRLLRPPSTDRGDMSRAVYRRSATGHTRIRYVP